MLKSVFVGTSLDGFIARKNGDFDFLSPGGDIAHGFEEFFASVDVIVMGRNTFEVVRKFEEWPYRSKRVVVLSTRTLDLSAIQGAVVEQMEGAPADIVAKLEAVGAKHLYIDGGITVQQFLRAGLIDRITVSRVPVLIGDGIPLFGSLPKDLPLQHIETRQYKTGLVSSVYEIIR